MKQPANIYEYYELKLAKAPSVVKQWYLYLNQQNSTGLREIMTDDFAFHGPTVSLSSPSSYIQMVKDFGGWVETTGLVADGPTIVHEFIFHMTAPAAADIPMCDIFQLRGELIASSRVYNNPADFPTI